jgi:hypothetical protein
MAQFYLQPESDNEHAPARLHRRGRGNTWPAIATFLVGDMDLVQNVLQVLGHDCVINDVEAKAINDAAEAKRIDPAFQAQMDTLIK